MQGYLIGALLFAVALAVFVLGNPTPVSVKFIIWQSPNISLALVVLLSALLGALVTFLLDSFRYFKVMKQLKEQLIKNKKLESQLEKARTAANKNSSELPES